MPVDSNSGVGASRGRGGERRPAPSAPLTALATLTGNLFLVLGTIFFASSAVLFGWLPPPGRWVYLMARGWSRGLLAASGLTVRSQFESGIDRSGRYIFMANHQSLFDIPALIDTLPMQTRFLAKRSLFRIPIFGWALKLGGFVTIDREDGRRAQEAFATTVKRLQSGSVLIFPEATRSEDGRLLPFKRGGMLLAIKSGMPIVPVGIRGTLRVQPRSSYAVRPGPVEVRYGAPIAVTDYGIRQRRQLEAEVRDRIAELAAIDR